MVNMKSLRGQSGAAILLALLIMTLVATLAVGMVWLQWRGIEVESAERARAQAQWLLNASLDWGNLILRSQRGQTEDDLGQPWATALAETKLSSFLSADGNHTDDGGPEAYLSGQITDAEGKYNLYNILLNPSKLDEIQRLGIICQAIGVPVSTASTIGAGLRDSLSAQQNVGQGGQANGVLMPIQIEDLAWYGIDPKVIKQLTPFIELLPMPAGSAATTINANTAPAEVLQAALPGISPAQAQQIVLARQSHPFQSPKDIWLAMGRPAAQPWAPPPGGPADNQVDVKSFHFEIYGQLRYEQHVIRERSVVWRPAPGQALQVLRRERIPPDPT